MLRLTSNICQAPRALAFCRALNVTLRWYRTQAPAVMFMKAHWISSWSEASSDSYLHFPDFVFDNAVERMFAQLTQVRIASQPLEIAVSKQQSSIEGRSRLIHLAGKRITAGEIVKDERVPWFEPRQQIVYLEAIIELSALGIVVSQQLQGFNVSIFTPDDPFKKSNFNIQLPRFFAGQFLSGTVFLRHTTA
jgi:hypothetical protein